MSPSHENWWNKETHSFSNRRWTCASPQYQLIYPKNKSIPNIIFFSKGLKIVTHIASKTLIINISKYIRSSDICMYIHTKHIHRYSFHEIKNINTCTCSTLLHYAISLFKIQDISLLIHVCKKSSSKMFQELWFVDTRTQD